MPSTYSPNLRLELIATGEKQGTWGATTNVNLGTLLEEAIGGYTSVTVSDAGDTTLTTNNGSADQSRNMVLNLTGTISAARNVICPAIEKLYVVKNATTGGYAVTIKVSGQTGVSIPNGSTVFVYVDGTDVRAITGSAALQSIGTSGATVPLLNGTNTWSSSQTFSAAINTFGSGSGAASVYYSGGSGSNKALFLQTTGLNRWAIFSNTVAESGANAGSNFNIGRYDDSGAAIDSPLFINRATGVTTIAQLALTTPLAIAQGGTGATSNSAARTNLGAAASGANTDLTSVYLNNTGLKVKDTDASHGLSIVPGSNLSADRVFTLTTGDASRTLDISASNVTISSAGAALIDDADASAQRTTLGLGTTSTQNSNNVSITGGAISGVTISGITDLAVADGGTGASSFTAYSVIAAGTTGAGALQSVGLGTTGQILTSNGAGALPTWQTLTIPVAFPSGTKLLFQQTNAPTGWTKDTTHNNKALRVVNGAVGSGGTVAFTTAFASQAVAGTVVNQTATGTVSGTVGDTALTLAQIPAHSHTVPVRSGSGGNSAISFSTGLSTASTVATSSEGSSAVHTHTFSGSFTGVAHSHTFTGTAIDLAVQYVDIIIATKD